MKFRSIMTIVIAFCTFTFATASIAASVPKLTGHVNDYAGLMSKEQRAVLEQTLTDLEKRTTAQVAILTVKNLNGEDLEDYSINVASTWKLGQKDVDNGLLILYTVQEDKYRVEVGYGLEGGIPDGKAGDIIRQKLRAHADPSKGLHDFSAGFNAAVQSISDIITKEYAKDPTGKSLAKDTSGEKLIFVLIAIALVANVVGLLTGEIPGTIIGCGIGFTGAWLLGYALFGYIMLALLGAICGFVGREVSVVDIALSSSSGGGGLGGGFSGGGGGFGGGGASG